MTKLDPDLKARWVTALRSGDYKQGMHYLKHNDEYCCLGVFCEIAEVDSMVLDGVTYFSGDRATLAYEVRQEFGITEAEVFITLTEKNVDTLRGMLDISYNISAGEKIFLTTLNDHGASFDVIADLIEEHL
jgi:hypothetical protein